MWRDGFGIFGPKIEPLNLSEEGEEARAGS